MSINRLTNRVSAAHKFTALPIVTYPDPRLKQTCEPVTEFNDSLKDFVNSLKATLRKHKGVGIAAPQVGVLKQVAVVEIKNARGITSYVLINPEIVKASGSSRSFEGCLSLPNTFLPVDRADIISIKYQDTDGNPHTETALGLLSQAFQHEIDHLNGILLIDRTKKTVGIVGRGKNKITDIFN